MILERDGKQVPVVFVHNSSSLRNQWIANFKTVHLNIKKHFLQIGSTLRELRETEQ